MLPEERRNAIVSYIDKHNTATVQELVDAGHLAPEDAVNHPKKNIITRALGIEPRVRFDITNLRLVKNDILMLCSDGLTSVVSDEEICAMLLAAPKGENTAERLVKRAIEAESHDNISAIVVKYDE